MNANRLHLEPVARENACVFGNPQRQNGGRIRDVGSGNLGNLSRRFSGREAKLTIATSSLKIFIVRAPMRQARYAKLDPGVKVKAALGTD